MKLKQKFLTAVFALFLTSFTLASAMEMSAMDFSDVPITHPNYNAIMDLKQRGLVSGYPDGSFKPEQTVNRVEALKIILGTAHIDVFNSNTVATFSDIDLSQWYGPYLNKAVELGVVTGYPDGTFKPTQTVNLVENLKMLLMAKEIDVSQLEVLSDPYFDAPKGEWYAKYLQYAKNNNLIDADAFGNIHPDQGMTRAKLAEVAYRFLVLEESQNYEKVDVDPGSFDSNGNYILTVNIQGMAFNKADMIVGLGSTVRWTNLDGVAHSVISDSGSELSSELLTTGESYLHAFNTEGVFEYHCGPHPSMKGKITVKPVNQVPTI